MEFEDWFDEIEAFSLRSERFYSDLDHTRPDSTESQKRMVGWLRAAYEAGQLHEQMKHWDDLK
jgi:hypothetical protein